jgi:hypothetical protein
MYNVFLFFLRAAVGKTTAAFFNPGFLKNQPDFGGSPVMSLDCRGGTIPREDQKRHRRKSTAGPY